MYVLYIIYYTDQSSSNHIPLDNEYQALNKPSHLHHHLHQHTIYDTLNQNSLKVYNYNNVYIQNICNCELLDTVPDIINYHCTSIDYSVHCD